MKFQNVIKNNVFFSSFSVFLGHKSLEKNLEARYFHKGFRLVFKLPYLVEKKRQVKVFDQCLDVLYQNLFFGAIILNFYEKTVGTKWYKICTTRISIFRIPPGDPCIFIYFHAKQSIFLMQHLFELNINY